MRVARLLLLSIVAALAVYASVTAPRPGAGDSSAGAKPRATDAMRPKVFDFPGHNLW